MLIWSGTVERAVAQRGREGGREDGRETGNLLDIESRNERNGSGNADLMDAAVKHTAGRLCGAEAASWGVVRGVRWGYAQRFGVTSEGGRPF